MGKIKITKHLFATFFIILCAVMALSLSNISIAYADNNISDFNELSNAIASAQDGEETIIYIDDISLPKNKPVLLNITNKNVVIKSCKENSVISSSTLGCIMVSANKIDGMSKIKFENISFKTQDAENPLNLEKSYSTTMQYAFGFTQGNVDATFENCSFEGYQYGTGSGACLSCVYGKDATEDQKLILTVNNCSFKNNVSKSGAIYLYGWENILANITNSTFEGNYASKGNAIYTYGSTLNISNSTFKDNKDYTLDTIAEGIMREGGAICSKSSTVKIDKCVFDGNEQTEGSALSFYESKATISNSIIKNNKAKDGSPIYVVNSASKLVAFINNSIYNNVSSKSKNYNVVSFEEKESTLPQEVKTKFVLNTFAQNQGTIKDALQDERITAFGNLFIDDEYTETKYPTTDNKYNAFINVNSYKELSNNEIGSESTQIKLKNEKFKIDNESLKDNVSFLYSSLFGTFYSGSNYAEKIVINIKDGKNTQSIEFKDTNSINLEDLDKFGYSFDGYKNYTDLSNALVSFDTSNEIFEATYSLNKNGIGLFIVMPVLAFVLIVLAFVIRFVVLKKKKNVAIETTNDEIVVKDEENTQQEQIEQVTQSTSWVENAINKPGVKDMLSEREQEVLVKLLEGKSRKACADELFVTESTIKKHSASIYKKFNVKNRSELVNKINNM